MVVRSASDSDVARRFLQKKRGRQYQGLSSWHMTSHDKYLLLSSKLESQQVVLGYSFLMPECSPVLTKCLDASVKQADTRAIERVDRQSA